MYACAGERRNVSSQHRGKGRRGWVAHLSRLLQRHQRLGLPAVRLSAVFVADLLGLRVARQGAVQFSASREARLAWVRRTRRANGSRRISRSVDLAPTTATGLATRERWRWAKIRSGARTSETSESP